MAIISRRSFLASAAAPLVIGGTTPIQIGLQLFSLRRECERDLAGTLNAVHSAGYEAVEFAGDYGHAAIEIREMLQRSGSRRGQ